MANQPKKYQKFVATAATATLVATAVVPAASADTKFSDISSYATEVQEEVLFLADLGVINGFEDGTFKPAQNITRGQAVKMIGRFLVEQGITEVPADWETVQSFDDIAVDRSDRDLVKYAAVVKEAGVFQGNGNVLNPSGFTTRENMALILDRLVGEVTGKTAVQWAAGKTNNVSDLANAKEEAREAIAALNALGVSNAEEFKPKNNTQRVHFASFLARMIELAESTATKVDSVTVIDENTIEVTFKTGETSETVQFTLDKPLVEGENKVTVTHNGVEYPLTVNYSNEAPTEGTVTAVTAINASEIKVDFSKTVDEKALEDAFNVTAGKDAAKFDLIDVDVNGSKDVAIADIQVSEDGKSAIVLLATPLKDGDKYAAQTNDQIVATDKTKFEEFASATATFNAEAAPKFVAAAIDADGSLYITFDRPVQTGELQGLKIDGVQLDGTAATGTLEALGQNPAGDYTYKVATGLASAFKTTGTHEVVAYYATSTGGTTAPVLFGTYTVTVDVVTPEVTAITAKGANTFFLSTNTAVDLSKATLNVKKGNITFTNEADGAKFDDTVTVDENLTIVSADEGVDEKGNPGIWVVVADAPKDVNGLYQGQETTSTVTAELTNYTANGLIGKQYSGSVTLAKDDNKPKVVKTDLNKETGEATINFGKTLTGSATDFVLRDKDGVIVTGKTAAISGDSIKITGLDKDKAPYTAEFKADQFNYVVKNATGTILEEYTATAAKNDALTVSVGVAESVNPVAPYYAFSLEGNVTAAPGTITINYGTDMGASALDAANYTLDGKALPTGTKLDFVNDKKTVRITLPEESYATTADQLLIVNTNVATSLGSNVVNNLVEKAAVNGLVKVTDNITPKLVSGLYQVTTQTVDAATSTNKVELTFSENVVTNGTTDDLKVVVNGAEIAVTAITAGEKANQLVVTLGQNINVSQTATVTINAESDTVTTDITDGEGNKAQAGTTATVNNYEYVSGTPQ